MRERERVYALVIISYIHSIILEDVLIEQTGKGHYTHLIVVTSPFLLASR